MTNKPMLSVERELLEKLVEEGRVSEISDDEWKELRALIDKPAAQHQGEPVASPDFESSCGHLVEIGKDSNGEYLSSYAVIGAQIWEIARLNGVKP